MVGSPQGHSVLRGVRHNGIALHVLSSSYHTGLSLDHSRSIFANMAVIKPSGFVTYCHPTISNTKPRWAGKYDKACSKYNRRVYYKIAL
ncbi:unnamed protein product [Nezara viridula]|uniref:Uncharacterized protein n=1 Tax=Nezara viridula TaxID=85310 RepID=A0A9P0MPP2_NEZVI|nr:unnamed protein product [Nezara viridula]